MGGEMGEKAQGNNEIKVCRACGAALVMGENWTARLQRSHNYTCLTCDRPLRAEYQKNYRAKSRSTIDQPDNPVKVCGVCGVKLVVGETWLRGLAGSHINICAQCYRAKQRKWATGSAELKVRKQAGNAVKYCRVCDVARKRVAARALRRQLLNKYGGVCACCGENRIEFLTIDHINGGGTKEFSERGAAFYRDLVREPKREDLRVLCMNCNWAMGMYGYCPHQLEKEKECATDRVTVKVAN